MKKKELIDYLANKTAMAKIETDVIVTEIFEGIAELVAKGEKVSIPNFGKFEITETSERVGRNPATGEEIEIPAKNRVKFKPSSNLKNFVNS